MTERQWNGKYDFERYLAATEWLREEKKNHRKLLLWACTACRRLGNLLADKRSWKVIEIAELKADGSAKKADVDKVREAGKAVPRVRQLLKGTPEEFAASAPLFLLNPSSAEFSQTAGIGEQSAWKKAASRPRTTNSGCNSICSTMFSATLSGPLHSTPTGELPRLRSSPRPCTTRAISPPCRFWAMPSRTPDARIRKSSTIAAAANCTFAVAGQLIWCWEKADRCVAPQPCGRWSMMIWTPYLK